MASPTRPDHHGPYHVPTWQMRTWRYGRWRTSPENPTGQLCREELRLEPRLAWLWTFPFQQRHPCGSPSTKQSLHNGRAGVFISISHPHHSEHPTHHHRGARWTNRPKSMTTFEILPMKCSIDNPNRSHHFPSGNSPSHHTETHIEKATQDLPLPTSPASFLISPSSHLHLLWPQRAPRIPQTYKSVRALRAYCLECFSQLCARLAPHFWFRSDQVLAPEEYQSWPRCIKKQPSHPSYLH